MKKVSKILVGLLSTVTLFSGLFFLNNKETNVEEIKYDDFYETVSEVEGVFEGDSSPVKLEPKNAYASDTLLDPIIKVQISDLNEEGKRSIRFVAAIPDLNLSAKFVRTMYAEDGTTFKGAQEYQVTEAYTSVLAGSSSVLPSSFGEGYNYFVTYTMINIPNDYWYYALDIDLILEATTENSIKLESNGNNEANVEGLMTNYYETYYDYHEKEDGTYEVSVKEDKRKDKTHKKHEVGNHKNKHDENRPNVAIKGEEVTSIAEEGFKGCSYMTELILPKYLKHIKGSAFDSCSKLKDVFFRGEISKWFEIVFDNEKAHPFVYADNFYNGDRKEVTDIFIPKEVTEIKPYAFYKFKNVENITFEEGSNCVTIGEYAFYGCTSLLELSIPKSVKTIGQYTFAYCTKITNFVVPEGVERLENNTFESCTKLESITLPESLKTSGTDVYLNCTSLVNLYYGGTIETWCNSSFVSPLEINGGSFYMLNENNEYEEVTSIIIPENITTLKDSCFKGFKNVKNIDLHEKIISIGWYAFSNCSSLTTIVIPEGITHISYGAFRECSSLTSIVIPEGVISIGDHAFYGCSSLINIEIPKLTTYIGEYAFYDCSSLTSIVIPEGVTSIGYSTFYGCSSLSNIEIPEGIESIGMYAFDGCSSLTSVTLPSTLESIGNSAFAGCSSLISIYIPEGVTSIGGFAFRGCSSLTDIIFDEYIILLKIEGYVFADCSSLTSIEIPEDVTSIDSHAFLGCISLTSIEIPVDVTSIGKYAFYECSSLTNINIPEGVSIIESNTFYGCSSLTSIEIPEDVTSIGSYAFAKCVNLTNIVIPESVESIGEYAFWNCSSLTNINIPEGVSIIENHVFHSCISLTSIELPVDVTSIGSYAFAECVSLTNIVIPEGVTSIGIYAFYGCNNLTIYCEASSKQNGWDEKWNVSNRPVYYYDEWEYVDGVPTPIEE